MSETTPGDLISGSGCPECDASVVSLTDPAPDDEPTTFTCANGHTWTEE